MKFGVCVFPGSNCDYDTYYVIRDVLEKDVRFIYYNETNLKDVDVLILPGGFSFGDYVRPGLLASKTSLMEAVIDFANRGGIVLGICNGFQILTESGLLPGALLPNLNGRFVCKDVYLRVETNSRLLTRKLKKGNVLRLPIAHHDGRYYVRASEDVLGNHDGLMLWYSLIS